MKRKFSKTNTNYAFVEPYFANSPVFLITTLSYIIITIFSSYSPIIDSFAIPFRYLNGIANESIIGEYEENIVMMMYDSVVIRKTGELAK